MRPRSTLRRRFVSRWMCPEFFAAAVAALALVLAASIPSSAMGAPGFDPGEPNYTGRKGVTLYVSRLGDGSDGKSWSTAFPTIQAALLAIPDAQGGHTVIVRPDAYPEANLYPSFAGAAGSYNLLVGDWDGSLGSGAKGWVVVDSGAPAVVVRTNPKAPTGNPTFMIDETGDPSLETGLKSVDWWGPWRCDPDFSGVIWDRWVFRHLYATGSEGGIGWDLTSKKGSEFSAVVDDCVGVGRFAGACVMAHTPRKDEPVVFRRSYFLNLDWWGDAGGVYVRGESPSLPETPHAVFEDSTIIGPDNALQAGWPGVDTFYTRVRFTRCRLIVLNFSQPHGTPSSGIICSGTRDGQQLHVDLEDTVLMGYKVFGCRAGEVSYALQGKVSAYVQYRQEVPAGIERLRFWPVESFRALAVPEPGGRPFPTPRPKLTKLPLAMRGAMENTPVIWRERPTLFLNYRDDTKNQTDGYTKSMYFYAVDLTTGEEIARFGEGHSFVSAYVEGPVVHVFGSEGTNRDWFQSLFHFTSTDLKEWKREIAIPLEGGENLFNCSVCRGPDGYVMAYESSLPVKFCFKFAVSKDLSKWEKLPGLVFAGTGNEYSACPCFRYVPPWYYVIYVHEAVPGHKGWVPFVAKSRDLAEWELSPMNPFIEATEGEGVNNSDLDLFEFEGNTYVFYATGDQQTWGSVRPAMYPGPLGEFFESFFPEGLPRVKVSARRSP